VISVLGSAAQAAPLVQKLAAAGIPREKIGLVGNGADGAEPSIRTAAVVDALQRLGLPRQTIESCTAALQRTGVLMTVDTLDQAQATMAAETITRHGALQVEQADYGE
jgi:hypothetical protein